MFFDISVFFFVDKCVFGVLFCILLRNKNLQKGGRKMINNYSRNRLYTDFPMDSYNIFCPERTHYPILAI